MKIKKESLYAFNSTMNKTTNSKVTNDVIHTLHNNAFYSCPLNFPESDTSLLYSDSMCKFFIKFLKVFQLFNVNFLKLITDLLLAEI